jgi:hypothetical protein
MAGPGSPLLTAGLVTGGLGLVGLGFGAGFGMTALSNYEKSNEPGRCIKNLCDATGGDLRDASRKAAIASTVSFSAGGVALAAGAALVVYSQRPKKTGSPGTVAARSVLLTPEGVSLVGRW